MGESSVGDDCVITKSSYLGRAAETFDKQQLLRERRCAVGLPPPMEETVDTTHETL